MFLWSKTLISNAIYCMPHASNYLSLVTFFRNVLHAIHLWLQNKVIRISGKIQNYACSELDNDTKSWWYVFIIFDYWLQTEIIYLTLMKAIFEECFMNLFLYTSTIWLSNLVDKMITNFLMVKMSLWIFIKIENRSSKKWKNVAINILSS